VEVNRAPRITSEPLTEAETGTPYEYAAGTTDLDNDSLTRSLQGAPAG